MKEEYYISTHQQKELCNKIKSIIPPFDRKCCLFVTLRPPVKVGYDNRAILESKFKTLRDLITRKKTVRNDFGEVGGYFVREYGETSALHFHLVLFDYRQNPKFSSHLTRGTFGEPVEMPCSDFEIYLKQKWIGLMSGMIDPEYPVFFTTAEQERALVNIEKIRLDEEFSPEKKLLDYFKKDTQKHIEITVGSAKPHWYGVINAKALRFKDETGIEPKEAA